MPLYFPRSEAEENSARWQLPADVGGYYGEPVMPDREIRIIDNPQHTFHRKFQLLCAKNTIAFVILEIYIL